MTSIISMAERFVSSDNWGMGGGQRQRPWVGRGGTCVLPLPLLVIGPSAFPSRADQVPGVVTRIVRANIC